eukprot:CAMPEP_0203988886 /NCGR_PEP_ID=MMETSP0360-20130528/7722_1 /ASSEMBLY_ACC=CAM_ASM_000342 /TAXON_ID=268821 /ORGANISM="Scrippsiella Hangoei, Strain SHTV-5" /LENGTH=35 /DNA_ID= /DNA_START= /DNA_END= /DNA_ORIENTATION=
MRLRAAIGLRRHQGGAERGPVRAGAQERPSAERRE